MHPTPESHSPTLSSKSVQKRAVVHNLGCKANWVDGMGLTAQLLRDGWSATELGGTRSGSRAETNAESGAESVELCIVNSCSVTDEADRQSVKAAQQLKARFPNAKIVLTGCAAEIQPEARARETGIDFVIGNQDKHRLQELLGSGASAQRTDESKLLGRVTDYAELRSQHPMDREWPSVDALPLIDESSGALGRARAFLKIQDGCNAFCTYCIIPYGRGPARSLTIPQVVEQVRHLEATGYREVVLTGINLGEFGVDHPENQDRRPLFSDLVEAILNQTRIERIRLSSLDPSEIDSKLLALMEAHPRLCPHFHVSLQSPHSRILRLMKRQYRAEQVFDCLDAISRLKSSAGKPFVGMDLITGFPGETLEEFEWTVSALRDLPWTRLHVFPYSERKGTPATKLPDSVPVSERARRAKILRGLSLDRMLEEVQNDLVDPAGLERDVLFESRAKGPDGSPNWWSGHCSRYRRVLVRSDEELRNQMRRVRVSSLLTDRAAGEVSLIGNLSLSC